MILGFGEMDEAESVAVVDNLFGEVRDCSMLCKEHYYQKYHIENS